MARRHAKLLAEVRTMNEDIKEVLKGDLFEARELEAFQVQGRFTDTLNPRSAASDAPIDLDQSAAEVEAAEEVVKRTMQTAVEKMLKFMVDKGWESPNGMSR
jgi:hypothetical protein